MATPQWLSDFFVGHGDQTMPLLRGYAPSCLLGVDHVGCRYKPCGLIHQRGQLDRAW